MASMPPEYPHETVVYREIPNWVKALAALLAVLWTVGAIGGIWFLAERADAPCDLNYVEIPGSPGKYQVGCND